MLLKMPEMLNDEPKCRVSVSAVFAILMKAERERLWFGAAVKSCLIKSECALRRDERRHYLPEICIN